MSTVPDLLAALDAKGRLYSNDRVDAYVDEVADALRMAGWLAPSEVAQHDAEVLDGVTRRVNEVLNRYCTGGQIEQMIVAEVRGVLLPPPTEGSEG